MPPERWDGWVPECPAECCRPVGDEGCPDAEVKMFLELPEWLVEAVRPPGDPRTFEQALSQLLGQNAELREEVERLREEM